MAFLLKKDREDKRYDFIENVLQEINREYIALNEDEKRRNNVILDEVLSQIIEKMKNNSKLFGKMFRRAFYGGSYFDNLKVGKPDEYDLDLLLDLPKCAEPTLEISDIPGYVHVHLENVTGFMRLLIADDFPNLARKLLDEYDYLSTGKAFELDRKCPYHVSQPISYFITKIPLHKANIHVTWNFLLHKQGPAFTLKLNGTVDYKRVKIDIDLVPCFVFTNKKWPEHPYRQNPVHNKPEFFVVPKKPTNGGCRNISSYWRLSFQEQESALICSLDRLKPSLRLLKKLRDTYDDTYIASYYLKTIYLWEVEENRNMWNKSLSYVFMTMLKKYQQYMKSGEIPYFWNERNNLIGRVNSHTLDNVARKLQRIISDIENHPEDPTRVKWHLTRIIVTPESAVGVFWSRIEDLPENSPQNSWCALC